MAIQTAACGAANLKKPKLGSSQHASAPSLTQQKALQAKAQGASANDMSLLAALRVAVTASWLGGEGRRPGTDVVRQLLSAALGSLGPGVRAAAVGATVACMAGISRSICTGLSQAWILADVTLELIPVPQNVKVAPASISWTHPAHSRPVPWNVQATPVHLHATPRTGVIHSEQQ
jgi:hypothetical protein